MRFRLCWRIAAGRWRTLPDLALGAAREQFSMQSFTRLAGWLSAAGLALAANEAPFIAEILRAGVLGVDRGQLLAGQVRGPDPFRRLRTLYDYGRAVYVELADTGIE